MDSTNPFDSLESSHQYVCLLQLSLEEARQTIDEDFAQATAERNGRRAEALQVVQYKLNQLEEHLRSTRRILNDLRTLRRMLLGERRSSARAQPAERVQS